MDIEWLVKDEDDDPSSFQVGEHVVLEDARWKAQISRINLRENLIAITTLADVRDEVVVEPSNPYLDRSWIAMNFMLSGRYNVTLPDGSRVVLSLDGAHMMSLNEWKAVYEIPAQQTIRHFSISMREEAMESMLGGELPDGLKALFQKNDDPDYCRVQPVFFTPRMRALVKDVLGSPLRGALRRMELEGAVIQLVANMAHHAAALEAQQEQDAALPSAMVEKVEEARKLLLETLAEPMSLADLARAVSLNEKDLNRGFRNLYDKTVFEVLRDERMEVARHVLEKEDVPLKQIAYRVGYQHVSNFITAFKTRYGVPPRQFMKEGLPEE